MRTRQRRFTRPWRRVDHSESISVEAANGTILAYLYFEEEDTRRSIMRRMSRAEAAIMADKIVQLPELLDELRALRAAKDETA